MTAREILGLVLIAAALVLTPVAWAFSRLLWLVAFLLLVLGSVFFFTARMNRRLEAQQAGAGASGGACVSAGRPMPADVHDYTGWGSGGRSETMDGPSEADSDGDA